MTSGEEIQKQILKKFMYNTQLRYNEIWDKTIASNKFNYHLQQLVEEGVIEKKEDKYQLTDKGTHIISSLDGVALEEKKKPIVCAFVMGYDEKGKKILVNIRKKQPFFNYVGIPGGKVEFGKPVEEQAKEEFLEETGLQGKLNLKLILNMATINEETKETMHHITGFFYIATELEGKLVEKNREGENMFITLEESSNYKKYPDFDYFTSKLLEEREGIIFSELKRFMKNNEFTGIQFLGKEI